MKIQLQRTTEVPASPEDPGAQAAPRPELALYATPRRAPPARTSQRLPAALRLLVARRAQVGIVPAAEAVFQVPGALAMPDQHQLVGSHGDGQRMQQQLRIAEILFAARPPPPSRLRTRTLPPRSRALSPRNLSTRSTDCRPPGMRMRLRQVLRPAKGGV